MHSQTKARGASTWPESGGPRSDSPGATSVDRSSAFAAMALTIAVITAVHCLTLCAFANAVAAKVKANRTAARWLERAAGVFLIGFGIRLVRD